MTKNILYTIPFMIPTAHAHVLPVVKVNFVFATNRAEAMIYNNEAQMHKEIEILNKYFVDYKNQPIFHFKFNKFIDYASFRKMRCSLIDVLQKPQFIHHAEVKRAFRQCFKVKKGEVYFFIYDAYSNKKGFRSVTSWGFHNAHHPFILIDWERLNYNIQSAEPHEMGHAFGLKHECEPNAKLEDDTNIMASSECGSGTGGKRNLGFTPEQIKIILRSYRKIMK